MPIRLVDIQGRGIPSPDDQKITVFQLRHGDRSGRCSLHLALTLYRDEYARYAQDAETARLIATDPLGPLADGVDVAEAAAWTIVATVLLNLDEMLTNG